MKRILFTILLVTSALFLSAQQCTTLWPYVYPEFMEGTLYLSGQEKLNAKFNVHVQESKLHYLDRGIIKETLNKDIVMVTIGDDIYMVVDGTVMKVVGSEERGFVATLILGDFDSLFNSSGAYGASSSSSAVMKLSSIDIGGKQIVNHMVLREGRDEGMPLPLKYKYFIVTKGEVYPASRRGIIKKLEKAESKKFKKFLKGHNIDWSSPQSMLTILDFFNK
jgi:hypothetical protein